DRRPPRACARPVDDDEGAQSYRRAVSKWERRHIMSIARATTPHVPEPQPETWSNCLVANGVAYVAGMTASGGDLSDEYSQAKAIFGKIKHLVEAAGGTMADITTVTIFVTDIKEREKVWAARREFFTGN